MRTVDGSSTRTADRPAYALHALSALWVAMILSLTLVPASGNGTAAGAAPTADAIRNILLFAPLGLLLGLSGRSVRSVALLAALLAAGIEITQLWIPGRYPGFRDVAMNTLGASAGGVSAHALLGPLFRSASRSAWVALTMGGLGALVVLLPGFLLRPAPPESRYFTAVRPDYPRYAVFSGRVLEAQIGDLPIESEAPSVHSAALRDRLLDGSTISVRADLAKPLSEITPLVRINDGSWEVLMVGVRGGDLVVRRHALAADIGLEEPLFRLSNALPPALKGPFHVELVPDGVGWLASIDGASPRRVGPTPASARRLLADSDSFSLRTARTLDAFSLALVFGVCAIWFRPRAIAIAGLILPAAAMVAGPSLVGVVASPPSEWAGVGAGLVGGGLVQAWIRNRALRSASHSGAQDSRS